MRAPAFVSFVRDEMVVPVPAGADMMPLRRGVLLV
jgi:hypothetical protein